MNTATYRSVVHWILYIALGGVFIYAGVLKVIDPIRFADAIYAFRLVPREAVAPLAHILPVLEILAGTLIVTGWQRRIGTLAALLLSLLFFVVILSALARGLVINCSCFGEAGDPSSLKLWKALLRDVILVGISARVYYCEVKRGGRGCSSRPCR